MTGPRSEPPIPMLLTVLIGLLAWPIHWLGRMARQIPSLGRR